MAAKVFPWEKIASEGGEMPDGLRFSEQILFLELRLLYCEVKRGIIDRQYATRERKRLVEEYRAYRLCELMGDEWQAQIEQTEAARKAYHEERTLENADRLVASIEGTLKNAVWLQREEEYK